MSERPKKDWRSTKPFTPSARRDLDFKDETKPPRMSRSRLQVATAYAPGSLFTWEGGTGICLSVPLDHDRVKLDPISERQLFDGIEELVNNWFSRALACREDPPIDPRQCLDDCCLGLDGKPRIDRLNQFVTLRPSKVGYQPWPLIYRCSQCGRLTEYESMVDQAANPLPHECPDGHASKWRQLDVVFAHWSGELEPLSPFRYDERNAQAVKIRQCRCGSTEFALKVRGSSFRQWKFQCLSPGCLETRDLTQKDPFTLGVFAQHKAQGIEHEQVEANMLPVSYRASSVHYPQTGRFIKLSDDRVVKLLDESELSALIKEIARLHAFNVVDPSDDELRSAVGPTEWETFAKTRKFAVDMRAAGLEPAAAALEKQLQETLEAWRTAKLISQPKVDSPRLAANVQARGTWSRRFDPIRLTVEHAAFVSEHIDQNFARKLAVDLRTPDALLSTAVGDERALAEYQRKLDRVFGVLGVERMVLVRNLPVLEYSFGFSRVSAEPVYQRILNGRPILMPVRLKMYPPIEGGVRPVYVLEQENEAIYVRLRPERVLAWLSENQVPDLPDEASRLGARYLELAEDFGKDLKIYSSRDSQGEKRRRSLPNQVYTLLHSLAHQLIHAMADLSGIDRDGIGEHLFPADLAFVIYRKGMTPDLGNVSALWRNHWEAFLERAISPRQLRCGSGHLCDERGGACPACLMLADITCIAKNNLLTRAVLKGGRPPMWEARTAPELVGFFKACNQ